MDEDISEEQGKGPPSAKLLALVRWYATHKRKTFPVESSLSNSACYKWIHANVGRIEREDAYAASVDFRKLRVDLKDPVSVIIALKYAFVADRERQAPHIDLVIEALREGESPSLVKEMFELTHAELWKALQKVVVDEIVAGTVPDDAQNRYELTDHQLGLILQKVAEDYPDAEINWG